MLMLGLQAVEPMSNGSIPRTTKLTFPAFLAGAFFALVPVAAVFAAFEDLVFGLVLASSEDRLVPCWW